MAHTYERRPPAIIEPLPDPIPRDQPPYPLTLPLYDGWEDTEIWDDLAPEPDPEPDPPPEADLTYRHPAILSPDHRAREFGTTSALVAKRRAARLHHDMSVSRDSGPA